MKNVIILSFFLLTSCTKATKIDEKAYTKQYWSINPSITCVFYIDNTKTIEQYHIITDICYERWVALQVINNP